MRYNMQRFYRETYHIIPLGYFDSLNKAHAYAARWTQNNDDEIKIIAQDKPTDNTGEVIAIYYHGEPKDLGTTQDR